MHKIIKLSMVYFMPCLLYLACTKSPSSLQIEDYNEWYSGGICTNTNDLGTKAFSHEIPNIKGEKLKQHEIGDGAFEAIFQSDTNSVNYGLGPLFNNVSCASCHFNDHKAKMPTIGILNATSLLVRLSLEGTDIYGGPKPIPFFGTQLQNRSISETKPEATLILNYIENEYQFKDGEKYNLQKPNIKIINPYKPLPTNYLTSIRVPLHLAGLGLLENISEQDLLQNEDINDKDNDGISGKINMVWNIEKNKTTIGLFGWKAGSPTVLQQVAAAYNQDMGITNYLFVNENAKEEGEQEQAKYSYRKKDLSDSLLHAVGYYTRTLAVPRRRDVTDENVQKGKQLFINIGCTNCHKQFYKTKSNPEFPELSNQYIFPYTDMLLHDMGDGLADGRTEFLADGKEWRTPPLWGLGLSNVIVGEVALLHDGRARNYIEAIMWHDGEAKKSKEKFANLTKEERNMILKFLGSL